MKKAHVKHYGKISSLHEDQEASKLVKMEKDNNPIEIKKAAYV